MKQKKSLKPTGKTELKRERRLLSRHYGATEERRLHRILRHIRFEKPAYWWKERRLWQKLVCVLLSLLILMVGSMYGIAQWYIHKHQNEPFTYGATFIPSYARYFNLDPQETLQAMINDLGIQRLRLVSYWDVIEKIPGQYDFSELDWQFAMAEKAHVKISLAVGLRQPRWPECHMPGWAKSQDKATWYPELKTVMSKVVERYKNSPSLDSYQLENEYFLTVFGECTDFSRDRLVDEFTYLKSLDSQHPVVISRSNNALGLPIGKPTPDVFGVSVYKRVWDKTLTKRYFEYPFPAWFYGFLAGAGEIVTGKNMIIHELQAEAWPPNGIKDASIAEQNKSLDAKRLKDRLEYGHATGMRTVDLWGVEWWYWRKTVQNDPSLWNTAKDYLREHQCAACNATTNGNY